MKEKYYIAVDRQKIIWGVGQSKTEARQDAKEAIESYGEFDGSYGELKTIPCDFDLYEAISANGSSELDTWHMENGVAVLDSETYKKEKRKMLGDTFKISEDDFNKLDSNDKMLAIFTAIKQMRFQLTH